MSDHRRASTSPRRAPVAADSVRNTGKHQGLVAPSRSSSCCAAVRAIPLCFLGTGGSLADTGFVETRLHLIAREKALDRRPATFRTVFELSGRGFLSLRVCPPLLS